MSHWVWGLWKFGWHIHVNSMHELAGFSFYALMGGASCTCVCPLTANLH